MATSPVIETSAIHPIGVSAAPLSSRIAAAVVLLAILGSLVTYKASSSLATIAKVQASHTLKPKAEAIRTHGAPRSTRPLLRTIDYLVIVWPALVFGTLIAATVRALVPATWFRRALGGSALRSQLVGGLAGAPLMLCSCCVAPVFASVQQRTRRLGPASALLLASPSLNPAALTLTFMLFSPHVAVTRVVMAVILVFGVSAVAARLLGGSAGLACSTEGTGETGGALVGFVKELGKVAATTLPPIVVGVFASSLLMEFLPFGDVQSPAFRIVVVVLVALFSVPLALPTFAEIPLALGLLAGGAPVGAAAALLIAGPAVNLPSLLTLRRMTSTRYALALAAGTFLVAVIGGFLV